MKRIFLFIVLMIFSKVLFAQTDQRNFSFCQKFFATEQLLRSSLRYTDDEEKFTLFISEVSSVATETQSILNNIEPTIKFTKNDIDSLNIYVKGIIKVIDNIISDHSSETSGLRVILWLEACDTKLKSSKLISKLLK